LTSTRACCAFAVKGERAAGYVAITRGAVRIGVASRPVEPSAGRRPPTGVEVVLEVDDVAAERDQVLAAGWPLDEDLQVRPWGLADFRLADPAGYYLRITNRHTMPPP
jgi:lactoylglutathione lyase